MVFGTEFWLFPLGITSYHSRFYSGEFRQISCQKRNSKFICGCNNVLFSQYKNKVEAVLMASSMEPGLKSMTKLEGLTVEFIDWSNVGIVN